MTLIKRNLLADVTAGLTVSFAAISLGAAFGTMSGRGAFAGMVGAAVIPIITSIFGGTRLQASGPTAPMTAVSAVVVAFAYDSFPDKLIAEQFITLIFIMNALLLIIAGIVRLGYFITLVPNVVILGFMNGIAVLIWKDQFLKIFGIGDLPEVKGGSALNIGIALITLAMIFGILWILRRVPLRSTLKSLISAVLWSIILMSFICYLLPISVEQVELGGETGSFGSYFASLKDYLPDDILTTENVLKAAPYAFQLLLLAYLDSLLTALVIDRITKERSNLNKELMAQGFANGVAAVFQAIPGAQATIRSVLLINEGAKTRLAGVLIGIFALISLVLLKNQLSLVPAAVFTGVLLKAGFDVCDKDFIKHYFHFRWFSDRKRNIQLALILYTTLVTVLLDLNIAVVTGTLLFYGLRKLWTVEDVESEFEEISIEEKKYITK